MAGLKQNPSPAPRISVLPSSAARDGKIDTAPAWLVYFVRFEKPTTTDTTPDDYMNSEPMLVINDCISATVNNVKGQAGNTASLTLKAGEIFYPYAVSPGDWVFVWMCDNRDDVDEVFRWIQGSERQPQRRPNGYWSGLKFAGRVSNLGNVDSTTGQGVRTITQTINCQSFLEMASTVYFTSFARDILTSEINGGTSSSGSKVNKEGASEEEGEQSFTATEHGDAERFANRILERAIGKSDFNKFNRFFGEFQIFGRSPDQILSYTFTALMGLDPIAFAAAEKNKTYNSVPTFSTAIQIPNHVSAIFGRKSNGKKPLLWHMYNIILGVQQYSPTIDHNAPWTSFFPKLRSSHEYSEIDKESKKSVKGEVKGIGSGSLALGGTNTIFYQTPIPLEGRIKYFPPLWDNKSIWAFMEGNLNNLVNEMYTCLRPGPDGNIVPTLVIREKPFSTGLFRGLSQEAARVTKARRDALEEKKSSLPPATRTKDQQDIDARVEAASIEEAKEAQATLAEKGFKNKGKELDKDRRRTNFFNVPRWVVPSNMLVSISVNQLEQSRINMTMVIPNNRYNYIMTDLSQDALMQKVYTDGSFCVDPEDVARNGLRADINNSNFDFAESTDPNASTVAVTWARMRADWMFNGHLKLQGSITLKGVQMPITEGDNLEFDGILFHIESISHTASEAPDGTKTFNTTCIISNGMLAENNNIWDQVPNYYTHRQGRLASEPHASSVPGLTDSQQTEQRNRSLVTGDIVPKKKR